MDELIRKQDALDAFNGEITVVAARNAGRVYTYLKMVTDRIKALPPVYVPDTDVEDMISRQGAMEMLMAQNVIMEGSEYHNGFNAGVNRAQEVIRNLPPVQPKRTCVNCGRTVNNGGWYADGRTRCPIEEHYALPKDGYCHLWEKRNVTDDDYPERRTDERTDKQTGGD